MPFEPLRPPARAQVLPISPLTPKDRKDLEDALAMDVDWVRAAAGGSAVLFRGLFYFRRWLRGSTRSQVALSFVQRAEDMQELRELVRGRAKVPPPPSPPSRTDWTRLVLPPILTGHVLSLLGAETRQGASCASCITSLPLRRTSAPL